jgi:DNA-directed RNA polymerase specialized sigma subunit
MEPVLDPMIDMPEPIIPLVNPKKEEQLALWKEWKVTHDDIVMEDLLDSLQPLMKDYVKKFADYPIPYTALLAQANIISRDAMENYDPNRSALGTYVVNNLKQMHRYVNKYQNIKYAPEYLGQEYGRYEDALRKLENDLGRTPSDEEVANFMELPSNQIARIRAGMAPEILSSSIPEEMGDEIQFGESVAQGHDNVLAYLRHELHGQELAAFDYLSGWGGGARITDTEALAKKLNVNVNDIYAWRRKWTKRLKGAGI